MAETGSFVQIGTVNSEGNFEGKKLRAQDVVAKDGISAEAHISDAAKHLNSELTEKITGAVQSTALGAASGVATLDENGKLTSAQLPDVVLGGMNYIGTFDPTTGQDGKGSALPAPAAANKGWYWVASAAGSFTPPGSDTALDIAVGDWIVSNGTTYDEVDNTTVDTTARESAQSASEEAAKMDAVFVASEQELAAKNLRPGALVFMEVTNA